MKLINFIYKHPVLATFLICIFLYPVCFGLMAVWMHLVSVYGKLTTEENWRLISSWYQQCMAFSAFPWLCITVSCCIANRNIYGRIYRFVSEHWNVFFWLPMYIVAAVVNLAYGKFLPLFYISMANVHAVCVVSGKVLEKIQKNRRDHYARK